MNTKETAHFILSWYVLKLTKYMYVMYVHLNIHYKSEITFRNAQNLELDTAVFEFYVKTSQK